MCEAAYDEKDYKRLAESEFPEPQALANDTPDWWQRYEVEIWNNKPIRVWLKPLTRAESDMTFEDAAKGIYRLAGLTQAESEAVLPHHLGESYGRIAQRLGIDKKSVFDRVESANAKLAALKEL